MLEKIERGYLRMRLEARKSFEQFNSDERGMATVEMVILIVVAVLIIGVVVNFLTANGFDTPEGKKGLIGYLFYKMRTSLEKTFSAAETSG